VVTYGNVLAALALFPWVRGNLSVSLLSGTVLCFLGVVQIAGAYALFVHGLRYVTATQASLVGMLEPISNPIWVFLFLGERPGAYSLLGGAIVLGAIGWRTLSSGPPAAEAVPPD
jgi:drug/metabolite transporter (DMT)-like permease